MSRDFSTEEEFQNLGARKAGAPRQLENLTFF
jgi:hypothetical protein